MVTIDTIHWGRSVRTEKSALSKCKTRCSEKSGLNQTALTTRPISSRPLIKSNNFLSGYKAEDWTGRDDWHYIKAYKTFKEMYPRISTGSPMDPWRVVRGDNHNERTQKTCQLECLPSCCETRSSWSELVPLTLKDVNPRTRGSSESEDTRESKV